MRVLAAFAEATSRAAVLARHHALSRGPIGATGFELLELLATSAADAARALEAEPGVLAAEPDARVSLRFTPNDPLYQTDTISGLGQWGLRRAQVDRAWDVQRGLASVIVATVDTGIDPGHPDLVGALVPAPRFVSVPDPACPVDTTNRDDNGHGTHVAGVIGASGNNGQGIVGAAFGARVMPIKALDCTGSGLLSDIARAITHAADSGARVVNISLGSPAPSATIAAAVSYALSKNVVVVAAAGNCGAESGTTRCPTLNVPDYPAAYPGVIAVGATDTNDLPTAFSTAASYVGIAAPGTAILSTFPTYRVQMNADGVAQNTYAVLRGTSQASPLVAAIAALLVAKEPGLTPTAVAQRLRASSDDVGAPGYDTKTGDGRVNAFKALTSGPPRYGARYQVASAPATLALASTSTLRTTITNTSSFTWFAAGPSPVRVSTHWFSASGALVVWDGPRASFAADVPPNASVSVDVPLAAPVPKGSYRLAVDLVEEGVTWFSSQGVQPLSLNVLVNAGYGATYVPAIGTVTIPTGASPTLGVTVTNTGTRAWPAAGANPVRLASHLRDARGTLVVWDGPRGALAADVPPGGAATITLPLPAHSMPGTYTLELDLVQEGLTWFSSEGVATKTLSAVVVAGYGARYTIAAAPALLPGGRVRLAASITNTGAFTWSPSGAAPIRLASHIFDVAGGLVRWDGPRAAFSAEVAPGATAQTTLVVDAPSAPGSYVVRADLVREGLTWFSSQGVPTADLTLTVVSDRRASLTLPALISVSRSAPLPIAVTVRNTSGAAFSPEGLSPVNVSAHWLAADGRALLWDGPRGVLPRLLLAGDQQSVTLPLAPPPAGASLLLVDLVQEGVAWFAIGVAVPVTVTP